MNEELEVIQSVGVEVIEAQQRAEYDIQIATAKRYPRDLKRVQNACIAIVTMDKDTAEACRYALPRGGKSLSGPSVHLARIIAQQYGNIRVDARVKQITDKQITKEYANEILAHTADEFAEDVLKLVKSKITVNQLNALTSFAYNVGVANLQKSTLLKLVNINPNDGNIAKEFLKWNKAAGKVLNGLTNRRIAESALYFTK